MSIAAEGISRSGISQAGAVGAPVTPTTFITRKRRHAMEYPFAPGVTYSVTAGVSVPGSQKLWELPAGSAVKRQVRIVSASGNALIYIAFGASGVTATSASLPVVGGSSEVFTIPETSNYISALSAGGAPTLYVTAGFGD